MIQWILEIKTIKRQLNAYDAMEYECIHIHTTVCGAGDTVILAAAIMSSY